MYLTFNIALNCSESHTHSFFAQTLPRYSCSSLNRFSNSKLFTREVDLSFLYLVNFNQKNSSMLCIGVKKIKIHFDTSQLCCGVVHSNYSGCHKYVVFARFAKERHDGV